MINRRRLLAWLSAALAAPFVPNVGLGSPRLSYALGLRDTVEGERALSLSAEPGDVMIVLVAGELGEPERISSVTDDTGMAWTRQQPGVWYAVARTDARHTHRITIDTPGPAVACSIVGANTETPFDDSSKSLSPELVLHSTAEGPACLVGACSATVGIEAAEG